MAEQVRKVDHSALRVNQAVIILGLLIAFIVNYRPAVCARLLERAAAVIDQRVQQPANGNGSASVPSGAASTDSVHGQPSAALNG